MKIHAFLLLTGLVSAVTAVSFSTCGTDDLGITSVSLSPDPIAAGSDVTITVVGTPDITVSSGSVKFSASFFGTVVMTSEYDLCSITSPSCPITSAGFTSTVTQTISSGTPAVTVTGTLQAYDGSGTQISCVTFDLSISTAEESNKILSDDAAEFLLREQFARYKEDFNKKYDEEEEETKFANFKNSVERIVIKNKYGDNIFGLTKFSDMSAEEFKAKFLTHVPSKPVERTVLKPSIESAPSSFDWRDSSAVTGVKNQGYCGSCWAFSIVETIESAWYLAGNTLTEFSEQQVVSCDTKDAGCNGGNTPTAYSYVESAGGLATEADYPYASSSGTAPACETNFTVSGGSISGYNYATSPCYFTCNNQDEDTLASNLASTQPASICVDASSWSDYTGGVMTTSSCSNSYLKLDHCVQLVGYSGYTGDASSSSDGYWLVRNSWDTDWGVDGYIYLQMGTNTCGVADVATTVTISS